MVQMPFIILAVVVVSLVDLALATYYVDPQEWADYKAKFNKDYTKSDVSEEYARFYYGYNKKMIDRHNDLYGHGTRTYKMAVNQFSDMRFVHFKALFPVATSREPSYDSAPPSVLPALSSYDPINDFGMASNIENQGRKCNSGWAYATAKCIELFQAQQIGNVSPASLSAQNLIDCAGRSSACKNQVPQAAFDYLTRYKMDLLFESDYNNNNTLSEPGMCVPSGELVTNLGNYSRLTDGDDESLKAFVSNGFPVVVEFNPTSFGFMHYSEGIFQPSATLLGSHYMVVIGYGTDSKTGLDYWLLQNSFDTTWGEFGLMKLIRSPSNKLIKNAIFPIELA